MGHDSNARKLQYWQDRFERIAACVYCGVAAQSIDHFIPRSFSRMLAGEMRPGHTRVPLLPACFECNSIAGNRLFRTVAAKRRRIHARLAAKYRTYLEMPEWSEEELGELGWMLQTKIRGSLAVQHWMRLRLAWRNTSNSSAAALAAIRFESSAYGSDIVRRRVGCDPTMRRGKR